MINNEELFVIGTYPDNEQKLEILDKAIGQISSAQLPIFISTHYYFNKDQLKNFDKIDYLFYDKENVISDWRLNYWIVYPKFLKVIGKMQGIGYHSVACLSLIMNSVLFAVSSKKFNIIHYVESDVEFRVDDYLKAARSKLLTQNYNFYGFKYELYEGIRTNIFSFRTDWYYKNVPDVRSWKEYEEVAAKHFDRIDLLFEFWLYYLFKSKNLLKDCYIEEISELDKYIIRKNVLDTGETDTKIKVFSSELDNKKDVIVFVINESNDNILLKIDYLDGQLNECYLNSGQIFYLVLSKSSGRCQITINNQLFKEYYFSPNNNYLECTFKFYDDRFKCIQWNESDNLNFL